MIKSKVFFSFCALALIFLISSCSPDSTDFDTGVLEDDIELRGSCCAVITGSSAICTNPSSPPPIFCANSCCDDAEYLWSGHPSINGLTSSCIDASGLDESVTEIQVEVKCPVDFGDLPDIPGNPEVFDTCTGTKSIKVCSEPTFSHPTPHDDLDQICYVSENCFDFSNATCFTNINIIDQHPGILASAVGSEVCLKAKFCSRTNPFTGFVTLQFEGPCGDGDIVTWDIGVGGTDCPECSSGPVAVDCEIIRCYCRTNMDCPTGFKCGPSGYCIKKSWWEG